MFLFPSLSLLREGRVLEQPRVVRPPREEEPLVQVQDVLLALHRLLVGLGHEVRAQVALVEGQHEEAVGQPARKEGVQGEVRAGVAAEAGCEEGKISSFFVFPGAGFQLAPSPNGPFKWGETLDASLRPGSGVWRGYGFQSWSATGGDRTPALPLVKRVRYQ